VPSGAAYFVSGPSRRHLPAFFFGAEHVRQLGGASPLLNSGFADLDAGNALRP